MEAIPLIDLAIGLFVIGGMIYYFVKPVDRTDKSGNERSGTKRILTRFKRVIIFYLYLLLAAAIFGLIRGFLGLPLLTT